MARIEHPTPSRVEFECPGCGLTHSLNIDPNKPRPRWDFNGNLDLPTIHPSIRVRWTYGMQQEQRVCHSFVRDGNIQFLSDCTHKLKGQTVALPEIE